jgi:hypothetical protein
MDAVSMHRKGMTTKLLAIGPVLMIAVTASHAQNQQTDVIRARFVRTLTNVASGQQEIVEEGTLLIAADGMHRIDTLRAGVRTAEIVESGGKRRIAMNLDTKQAVTGSTATSLVVAPSSLAQVPTGVPDGLIRHEQPRMDLGTKIVGALTLRGTAFATVLTNRDGQQFINSRELWDYQFPDRRVVPVIVEMRFETPGSIDERRVTDAIATRVDKSVFELPSDFSVRRLP